MCLFRKCDESIVETKEYPSLLERLSESKIPVNYNTDWPERAMRREVVTTIKCAACGRIRIDQRSV